MTNKFVSSRRSPTPEQAERKQKKKERRAAKQRLADAIVRNAKEQGVPALAKPGAAKQLVDRLIKQQIFQIRQGAAPGEGTPTGGAA